ncbi:hypothetical protein MMC29_002673 [Sticta canariensis]|nr:hypothetical protein [Sticta canariensis]
MVKVARQVAMDEANQLLGQVSLRRLRRNKREGRHTVPLQPLAALTDVEQDWFGISEPLSIFRERISAALSSNNRRRLRENAEPQADAGNAKKWEQDNKLSVY